MPNDAGRAFSSVPRPARRSRMRRRSPLLAGALRAPDRHGGRSYPELLLPQFINPAAAVGWQIVALGVNSVVRGMRPPCGRGAPRVRTPELTRAEQRINPGSTGLRAGSARAQRADKRCRFRAARNPFVSPSARAPKIGERRWSTAPECRIAGACRCWRAQRARPARRPELPSRWARANAVGVGPAAGASRNGPMRRTKSGALTRVTDAA